MTIVITPQSKSIQTLYSQYRSDKFTVDRTYQRKLVWTLPEKQALVDSVLNQYPIPLILLADVKGSSGYQYILDGMQRLNAIFDFIENRFPLTDETFFDANEFPTAKQALEDGLFIAPSEGAKLMTRVEVSKLLDYNIPVSVISGAEETDITTVFSRINSYGRQLSDQERRQAGVLSDYSECVRDIASRIRGDVSEKQLPLSKMPAISIDSLTTGLGYGIQASEIFWSKQKILRSTDLRNAEDEQVIADIVACLLSDELVPRSKDALDKIYDEGSDSADKIDTALSGYGAKEIADEVIFIVSEIEKIVEASEHDHLRSLVFKSRQTNAYPTVFATIALALHEKFIGGNEAIVNYAECAKCLSDIAERIKTGKSGQTSAERKKNVATVVGNISAQFEAKDIKSLIYSAPNSVDIRNQLTAAQSENAVVEVKLGLHQLNDGTLSKQLLEKLPKILCGMANLISFSSSILVFGITDNEGDASTAGGLDNPKDQIADFYVTGVDEEINKYYGGDHEKYRNIVRDVVKNSKLSGPVKSSILESITYTTIGSKRVLVLRVPRSEEVCLFEDDAYVRENNEVRKLTGAKLLELARRKSALSDK